ncbi:MAG: FG-GAP repeat domain-containing protein [Acidimicrobiia bacterium]
MRSTARGRAPTTILRNDNGKFTQVATLPEPTGARSVGLFDYDGDGHLDLFIGEDRFAGGSSVLLRGHGDFTFDDVTESAGIGRGVVGMGVGTGDLNGDGRPDLFVGGSNRLFLNQGDGRFAPSSASPPAWPTFGTEDDPAGVAEGDLNGDGRPDLVIGEHYNSTLDFHKLVPIRLYLNEPDGSGGLKLQDVTAEAGLVGFPTKSPHVEIADLDSDGWPDIVTTAAGQNGQPIVFHNLGHAGNTPAFEPSSPPGPAQYWVTGAVFDADHDGRLDLVTAEWVPTLPTRFWRNTGEVGHWLSVAAPNGTTVAVSVPNVGSTGTRLATATVGVSTGYSAGPSDRVDLGLGAADSATVSITRPGARAVDVKSVRADRLLVCRG